MRVLSKIYHCASARQSTADLIGNLRPFPFRAIGRSLGTNCPRSIRSQSDGLDLLPHSTER